METIKLSDASTRTLIETMLRQRNLVPILGAGFTKACEASGGPVPDGEQARELMLQELKRHAGGEADALKDADFPTIASYFWDPQFVPTDIAKAFVASRFIGVELDAPRKLFLSAPWPYIYTLNIDDAIERNSVFTHKVVPNRNISSVARSMSCVYKVHGDAAEELLYDEPSKIIFSTAAYVRSLVTNSSMLNHIKTDLVEQNTLFVGCSLQSEIDLLFALAEYQGPFAPGRKSIFVTSRELNRFELARLAAHGVNTLLHIPTYSDFYTEVGKWAAAVLDKPSYSKIQQFEATGTIKRLGMDRNVNLSFLLREPEAVRAAGPRALPEYYVERDIEDSIIETSAQVPLILLRGRRFSGRTLLLKSVGVRSVSKNVYFVDSNSRISAEVLDAVATSSNGLFLFDSNTLTPETAKLLTHLSKSFLQRQSCAIVAASRTEPDVVGSLVAHVEDRADYEVEPRLSEREAKVLNSRLDRLGLLRFEPKKTLLENTYLVLRNMPGSSSLLSVIPELSDREFELLLVVAVADKAFSSLATALDIRIGELYSVCNRLAPVLDLAEAGKGERLETHSRFKVVTNSTTGLGLLIRKVIDKKGYEWLADRFATLVKRLVDEPDFRDIGQSMYMFDAVNYVLSQGEGSGAGYRPVVRNLYEGLQETLSESPDYWLQRAKAVLAIEDDVQRIIEGVQFATKALRDAERERTADNAEFLLAQLYGKLCFLTKYRDVSYIVSAVQWFAQAIRNYDRNPNYIRSMLEPGRHRKSTFEWLCDYLSGPLSYVELLPLKADVEFILSTKRSLGHTVRR